MDDTWVMLDNTTPNTDSIDKEKDRKAYPTVAICICRYQESIDDLIKTVESCLQITWPKINLQLCILDDGWYMNDEDFRRNQLNRLGNLLEGNDDSYLHHSNDLPTFETASKLFRSDCAIECNYLTLTKPNSDSSATSVTLITRQKPKDSHFKAGNLNSFLYNYLPQVGCVACPEYTGTATSIVPQWTQP